MWFTSDTHFGHRNVIASCNRPFNTVEEMHRELIARWNARVKPRQIVWVLGDFSMMGIESTARVMAKLNGEKRLVKGNHDKYAAQMIQAGFANVYENHFIELEINGKMTRVNMSHFPYLPEGDDLKRIIGPDSHEYARRYLHKKMVDTGHYLLHGHVHTLWKKKGRMINVGCDVWDFAPVHFKDIVKLIEADHAVQPNPST